MMPDLAEVGAFSSFLELTRNDIERSSDNRTMAERHVYMFISLQSVVGDKDLSIQPSYTNEPGLPIVISPPR
ncbi:hypothetical protein GWI33_016570 [Rhynchophorus ferrugineus]|uniref:Uncharacterized protein n=1 Tax=Rhynchophorus ferrugineus TaxID=354439 RepID=A0A834M8I9_RHYFE|nr:hypothetical protein GWI33_016570 [Rhynchophorus ferrugineus]